tara:strand:+ start:733 stop:906 length:174 start_codon:yes stop_codon:yes gene_type:complete
MKKYVIEFKMTDGTTEIVELITDRLNWSIDQWRRNRAVSGYEIIKEGNSNNKKMLLG